MLRTGLPPRGGWPQSEKSSRMPEIDPIRPSWPQIRPVGRNTVIRVMRTVRILRE